MASKPFGSSMKKDIFGCLFSVIFVPCGTSDIYFVSDIALRQWYSPTASFEFI